MFIDKDGNEYEEEQPDLIIVPEGAESAYIYYPDTCSQFIEFYRHNDWSFYSNSRGLWMPCGSYVRHKAYAVKIWPKEETNP